MSTRQTFGLVAATTLLFLGALALLTRLAGDGPPTPSVVLLERTAADDAIKVDSAVEQARALESAMVVVLTRTERGAVTTTTVAPESTVAPELTVANDPTVAPESTVLPTTTVVPEPSTRPATSSPFGKLDATVLPSLGLGDEASAVRTLRSLLEEVGQLDSPAEATGEESRSAEVFDDVVEAAVIAFQQDSVLEVDGKVGRMTWAALIAEARESSTGATSGEEVDSKSVPLVDSYTVDGTHATPNDDANDGAEAGESQVGAYESPTEPHGHGQSRKESDPFVGEAGSDVGSPSSLPGTSEALQALSAIRESGLGAALVQSSSQEEVLEILKDFDVYGVDGRLVAEARSDRSFGSMAPGLGAFAIALIVPLATGLARDRRKTGPSSGGGVQRPPGPPTVPPGESETASHEVVELSDPRQATGLARELRAATVIRRSGYVRDGDRLLYVTRAAPDLEPIDAGTPVRWRTKPRPTNS